MWGGPSCELYLASKVLTDAVYEGHGAVRRQIERSLIEISTNYLDLYLAHWPVPGSHSAACRELQEAQREGLVKSIGVSNHAKEDVEELLQAEGVSVVPAVNQIELNPFLYRPQTLAYLASKGITVQVSRVFRGIDVTGKCVARVVSPPLELERAAVGAISRGICLVCRPTVRFGTARPLTTRRFWL